MRGVVVLGKARSIGGGVAALALAAGFVALGAGPAGAVSVSTEAQLRAAFLDVAETEVVLTADIDLTDCGAAHVLRPGGAAPLVVSGAFTISQTCPGHWVIGSAARGRSGLRPQRRRVRLQRAAQSDKANGGRGNDPQPRPGRQSCSDAAGGVATTRAPSD